MLKKINDTIQGISFTVSGGFALALLCGIGYILVTSLFSFVGMHIEWFNGTMTDDDIVSLVLYYITFAALIYIVKTTTITKNSD